MRKFIPVLLLLACSSSSEARNAAPPASAPSDGAMSAPTVAQTRSGSSRPAPSVGPRVSCVVTTVHDGDTFRCRGDMRVRLLLVDAPEIDQPAGPAARDALSALLPRGSTAWLEFDVQREDRYGRTLAYVWSAERGGSLLNLEMAEDGWVAPVVFPPNVRRIEEIRAAVARAKSARRGIWASSGLCLPIDHKKGRC